MQSTEMPAEKGEIRDPICPQKIPGKLWGVPEELWMKGVYGNRYIFWQLVNTRVEEIPVLLVSPAQISSSLLSHTSQKNSPWRQELLPLLPSQGLLVNFQKFDKKLLTQQILSYINIQFNYIEDNDNKLKTIILFYYSLCSWHYFSVLI